MDVRERSQNWWAGMRRVWDFTRLSDTEEQCNACGVVMARRASAMKAHHQSHLAQQRRSP
jgi:hypothetical protein